MHYSNSARGGSGRPNIVLAEPIGDLSVPTVMNALEQIRQEEEKLHKRRQVVERFSGRCRFQTQMKKRLLIFNCLHYITAHTRF